VNALRHLKRDDVEEKKWQWRNGAILNLGNLDPADSLLSEKSRKEEFDITGIHSTLSR
jgi:hypothetical protein